MTPPEVTVGISRLLCGDSVDVLKSLPDASVHCCVTSPPYYGLRDYGHTGQIGAEKSPTEYVARLVAVFAEVRRVLRKDGTVWLNLGDSYAGSWGAQSKVQKGKHQGKISKRQIEAAQKQESRTGSIPVGELLKPKDVIGIPWMVAFALRDAGWYLRQDIVWSKPNPTPESVQDRCTKAHEYIFLLSKSKRYHFDRKFIQEPATYAGKKRGGSKKRYNAANNGMDSKVYDTRNKRSVWTVRVRPYKKAHFATYPPELIEPCVLAGCPQGGTVLDPFNGAGTTGMVAMKYGRHYIGIDINPEYIQLAAAQLRTVTIPFSADGPND